ncbi:MAG: DNA starvation/stationary phase protection protein [Phycisphaerales bacterium]
MAKHRKPHHGDVVLHLQKSVSALIDLSLQAKQAHWNATGPSFKPVHVQLDELVDVAREHADDLAERMAALGHAVEGGLAATAKRSPLEPLRDGFLDAIVAATEIAKHLRAVVDILHDGITALDGTDPVSQDMLIEASGGLEKQLWMLESLKR